MVLDSCVLSYLGTFFFLCILQILVYQEWDQRRVCLWYSYQLEESLNNRRDAKIQRVPVSRDPSFCCCGRQKTKTSSYTIPIRVAQWAVRSSRAPFLG